MRLAVYLPLLCPLLAALLARPISERLEPRTATWVLTVSAVVLALASWVALGVLAATALVRVPPVAAVGRTDR